MDEVAVKTSLYNYLKISKKKQECVGMGMHVPEFKISISKRLSNQRSVYTGGMVAVIIGSQWVEEVRPDRLVMFTDPKNVLKV